MKRREFLSKTGTVAAGAAAALMLDACTTGSPPATEAVTPGAATQPAAATDPSTVQALTPAQSSQLPTLEWRMATSWPVALDTIFGGATTFADRVKAMTGGKFTIRPYAGGELAPATQVLDVVQQGAVECGHTASYYYVGKSPITAFGTALPFGFTAQQQNAFLYEGGALAKLQELYAAKFNIIQFPAGNTGTQMGGWFRKEINTVADLQGLKMRIPGLGGEVMKRLGVVTQTIPGGEIFTALDAGTVDAAEWVGPYDDEKLGLNKAAQFYYYPGWWEPGAALEVQINLDKWKSLPVEYQEIMKSAAYEANLTMLSRYEARNREALARLVTAGTQLRPYSQEILQAAQTAAFAYYAELAAKDPDFKAVYDLFTAFRTQIYSWNKLNEGGFEDFVFANVQ